MSEREFAKSLIDRIPESRLHYVIAYWPGATVPDETPNAETLEAFAELDNGGGYWERDGREILGPAQK